MQIEEECIEAEDEECEEVEDDCREAECSVRSRRDEGKDEAEENVKKKQKKNVKGKCVPVTKRSGRVVKGNEQWFMNPDAQRLLKEVREHQ